MLKTAAPETDIVITSEDGVIEIMSQAQADNKVITRTYFIQDLLTNLRRLVSNQTDLATLKKLEKPEEKPAPKNIPQTGAGILPPAVARAPGPKKPADTGTYNAVHPQPRTHPQSTPPPSRSHHLRHPPEI